MAACHELLGRVARLNAFAPERRQSLAAMPLSWLLRRPEVTSVLVGASRPAPLLENLKAVEDPAFTDDELTRIDAILADKDA